MYIRRIQVYHGYKSGVSISSSTARTPVVESLWFREHCAHVFHCWGCKFESYIHLWSNQRHTYAHTQKLMIICFYNNINFCIPGALNQLGRNLACEWASDNIRVNSVCPWFITTPATKDVYDIEQNKNLTKTRENNDYNYFDEF